MDFEIGGTVIEWRGPAPYHFLAVGPEESAAIDELRPLVTYGWGMVPAEVRLGATTWRTSLWPKDGGYLIPLKDAVRRAEGVEAGDEIALRLRVG
ncbi:DUF1905 domain-containing protein [Agromyces seonyuensis]|uniref:DUF1905 domain-containing protein n=1 Tax=Agromyces seonyuensis TaxID=2662446 RepID=A0A6I4P4C6_9MICO|nr:DUF1905 domain-containing protein [Agromyces seonyuensis]MWB99745.1 DUF1905 domain-containing protein [Agromyces seonyuensis]